MQPLKKINEWLRVKQQHSDLEGQSNSVLFRHNVEVHFLVYQIHIDM